MPISYTAHWALDSFKARMGVLDYEGITYLKDFLINHLDSVIVNFYDVSNKDYLDHLVASRKEIERLWNEMHTKHTAENIVRDLIGE